MAEIIKYNSRVTLKYDTLENWKSKPNSDGSKTWIDFTPLKGEVCIINPAENLGPGAGCLIKIGDGNTPIKDLPYLSAVAADVYAWAKQDAAKFLRWATNAPLEGETFTDSPKLVSQDEIDLFESDFNAFRTDINRYREEGANGRWKDGPGPDGRVIADTYATKGELETLSTTIGNLSNVMNFRGVVTPSEGKDDPNNDTAALTAFIKADNNVPFIHGDVIVYGNKEYVYVVNGESGSFVEFGDTQAEEQRLGALESDVSNIRSYATIKGDDGGNGTTADKVNDTLEILSGDDWIETKTETDKLIISHSAVARTDNDKATDKPAHEGSFTAVKSIESDGAGHVTKVTTTTVTLPSVKDIESAISDLQNHVWRTETANTVEQAASGSYTDATSLGDLAKSDLKIATESIGYIIWDCGSASVNV